MLKLSLILGTIAALADVAGGFVLVRARGVERYLRYFVALGAGFLMATALLEMMPEGLKLNHCIRCLGPILIMAGYCVVHLLEHTINAHFHFGEETHQGEFVSRHTGNSVMAGLSLHALFDGVAIGSGFLVSDWLGWLIFLAILLHKAPEGFTMASRDAGQRAQPLRGLIFRGGVGGSDIGRRAGHRAGPQLAALWAAHLGRRGALCCRHRLGARGQPRARHPHGAGLLCRRGRFSAAAAAFTRALTVLLRLISTAFHQRATREFAALYDQETPRERCD